MNELGEAMGHIDNALDIIKNRDKPKNEKCECMVVYVLLISTLQ